MLRKLALRLRDEERGIALIIALGVIVVLSIAMASAIDYSSANSRKPANTAQRAHVNTPSWSNSFA